MVYEVVLPASGNRFEFEREEPLKVDEYFTPGNLTYKVLRIKPVTVMTPWSRSNTLACHR